MRQIDRADHAELAQYHKSRRKANEANELDALFTRYALALSFFERWQKRGVHTVVQITAALNRFGKDRDQDKLDWLREQIEMRTIGLGWTQFKGQWSSSADEDIGSVEELRGHLKSILEEEDDRRENGELPSKTGDPKEHCPAPQLQRK
eukprot:7390632-Prymnesium_polylepis.1